MAKWGEGDPRWIVQEREDGTNLNDWHWVEKSIMPWVKKELERRFADALIYDGPKGQFHFDGAKTVDGTCSAHVRRGRRFVMYDFNVVFKYKGNLSGSEEEIKGEIKIPYIGDENDHDDFEFRVSTENGTASEKSAAKNIVHTECKKVLKKMIVQFMEDMNETWTKGPLRNDSQSEVTRVGHGSDAKDAGKSAEAAQAAKEAKAAEEKKAKAAEAESAKRSGGIEQKVTLNAPVDVIFETFKDRNRIQMFTQSAAEVDPVPGGGFSLFSGNVTGEFVELVANKKIVQKWRFSDWPAGVFSTVTLEFESGFGSTNITLRQEGIPASDLERTKEGWFRFYWNNFRNMFGGNIGNVL